MARGSAQNAKGNKANNQPASAKGAGSHLRANKGHEADFDDFEPMVEPSANRDIAGVVIAVLAIASFIAVISPATAPVTAAVAGFYHLGFGLGAYVLPIVILLFAATLFLGEDSPLNVRSGAGGAVVFIAVVSILSLMVPGTSVSCDLMFTPQNLSASGGYIGAFIASALQNALGKPIAMVVLLGLVVVGLVIIGFSVGGVLRSARDRAADFAERRRADVNASPWGDDEALSVPGVAHPHLSILRQKGSDAAVTTVMGNDVDPVLDNDDEDEDPFVDVSDAVEAERAKTTLLPRRHAKKGKAAPKLNASEPDPSWSDSEIELTEGDDEDDEAPIETAKTTLLPSRHAKREQVTGQLSMEDDPDKIDESEPPFAVNPVSAAPQIPDFLKHPKVADAPASSAVGSAAARDGGADGGAADNEGEEEDGLKLPPLEILHANPQSASSASSDKELEQTAESLQSTLLEFGRSARVVGWIAGPTVTTFKLQPGEGERVSKISSLEDDIALSLAAQSVRIFAPIPGTSLVGIEIPNRKRQNVNLGDVLPYVKGGPLELAIGRDAEGTPVVADLAKMPHLLIAGTTGSGKSVMINSIITTLLKRDYIERSGKSIRPTEKGLYLYESVKDMMVADAKLTGTWEKALEQIEGRTLDPESFMLSIREYTGKVTGEILRLKFPEPSSCVLACPKCKTGNVVVKSKVAKCDREGCGLLVFRHFLNKELTDQHLEQLFSSGSTRLIKGFKGKKGVSFDAAIIFDESFNLKLSFPKSKGGKGK